jgi:hypothetical protein
MTELHRPTAKIYSFPAGGRAPPSWQQQTANPSPYAQSKRVAASERAPNIVYGSSWYHQAAVDEAEGSWER